MLKMELSKINSKLVIVLVCLLVPVLCASSAKRLARLKTDALSKTRCDLMCYDVKSEEKGNCRNQCRQKEKKPGTCPLSDSPNWSKACVEACDLDSQCDGTQKCCQLGCGATCSEPQDLMTMSGLPPLPALQDPMEKRKSVILRWSGGVGDSARAVPGRTLYLVEEQHHVGPKYEEARLGPWNLILRTNKTKAGVRNIVKPGRWYRFRVAAVSAAGTRGFSTPSTPFTLRKGPRPSLPPKKLKVKQIGSDNGTITVRLEWREPRSDLPVMKYKVYWSRRVLGLGRELDSVLVSHITIDKDKHHLDIKGLLPNSMYFFQVQSISQFGLRKLRSDKAAIFYNTTSANAVSESPPEALYRVKNKNQTKNDEITGLKLLTFVWTNHSLSGRIIWNASVSKDDGNKSARYNVHWRTVKCEKPGKHEINLAAVTLKTTFDIYEIDFDCTYKVIVNKSAKIRNRDAIIHVKVPSCKTMQQKLLESKKQVTVNCPT